MIKITVKAENDLNKKRHFNRPHQSQIMDHSKYSPYKAKTNTIKQNVVYSARIDETRN